MPGSVLPVSVAPPACRCPSHPRHTHALAWRTHPNTPSVGRLCCPHRLQGRPEVPSSQGLDPPKCLLSSRAKPEVRVPRCHFWAHPTATFLPLQQDQKSEALLRREQGRGRSRPGDPNETLPWNATGSSGHRPRADHSTPCHTAPTSASSHQRRHMPGCRCRHTHMLCNGTLRAPTRSSDHRGLGDRAVPQRAPPGSLLTNKSVFALLPAASLLPTLGRAMGGGKGRLYSKEHLAARDHPLIAHSSPEGHRKQHPSCPQPTPHQETSSMLPFQVFIFIHFFVLKRKA